MAIKEKQRLMREQYFSIAKDFSKTPGPRFKDEGAYSAEDFLETKLVALFQKVIKSKGKLLIDLDGTAGYATSFLKGTFGGLSKKFSPKVTLTHLDVISERQPFLRDEIIEYIKNTKS